MSTEDQSNNVEVDTFPAEPMAAQVDMPVAQVETVETVTEDKSTEADESYVEDSDIYNKTVSDEIPCAIPRSEKVKIIHDILKIPPTESVEHLDDILTKAIQASSRKNAPSPFTVEQTEWLSSVLEAVRTLHHTKPMHSSIRRETGDWRQGVDHEGVSYRMTRPKFDKEGNGQLITGEEAIYRVTSLTGMGTIVHVPLWNTGIWVSIKAPTNSALLELDRVVAERKIDLGSSTAGLIFSNDSAFITMEVVNLALKCISSSSIDNASVTTLKNTIRITDIPALIWGLACAIYSDGYPMDRPCVNPKCMHTSQWMLKLNLLHRVDNARVSLAQRQHMARRSAKFTMAEIATYQSQHEWAGKRDFFELHDGAIKVKFKVPTLNDYETAANAWIDGIVSNLEKAMTEPLVGEARNQYIHEQAHLTALRQYGHWIDNLTLSTQHVVQDNATLQKILEYLSGNKELTESFFETIGNFIDDVALDVIAIPKYPCVKCTTMQTDGMDKHPQLIVLNPVTTFFILATQRIVTRLT